MAQLEKPTQKDWASQILEDLVVLEINLELEDIEEMKKDKFKNIVKEAVRKKAFSYLIKMKNDRKSDNAKGKILEYENFCMPDYLCPTEEDITIEERKHLFKCRVDDLNVKGNQRWKHQDISCLSCKKQEDETQCHLLFCKDLIGKNSLVTYIPDYKELYYGDINEQIYVSRLLKENLRLRDMSQGNTAAQPM